MPQDLLHRPLPARTRLLVALVVGTGVGLLAVLGVGALLGLLCGIAALHTSFVLSGWVVLWPMTAADTRANHRQDLDPVVDEVLVVVVALGALVAIGVVLALGGSDRQGWAAGVALLGVFMAWASLHLLYGVRYARMYYLDNDGDGIDFNSTHDEPAYRDFLYVSYTLGMTYAISDTNVGAAEIRAVMLRHALLSYVFGAVVLASTINLVAQVATG